MSNACLRTEPKPAVKAEIKNILLELFKNRHIGIDNRISRNELEIVCHDNDRSIRDIIKKELVQKCGVPVVSNSRHSGYWHYKETPVDREEAEIAIAEAKSRIREIRLSIVPIRKALSEGQGQQLLFKRA